MAERFVNVDRQTPMLLPPDLREWVANNELAHLVLEAVELCDLRAARLNVRGSGSEQYPPTMMLALLIYAYATGLFSSRRIERATYDSMAVRYLCANHHPDHDTIAKFRRENEALFRSCFGQVLLLAREAGVLRVGAVSVDGTRLAGAGSARAVRRLEETPARIGEFGRSAFAKGRSGRCERQRCRRHPIAGGTVRPRATPTQVPGSQSGHYGPAPSRPRGRAGRSAWERMPERHGQCE